jgi:hypothetical protein
MWAVQPEGCVLWGKYISIAQDNPGYFINLNSNANYTIFLNIIIKNYSLTNKNHLLSINSYK